MAFDAQAHDPLVGILFGHLKRGQELRAAEFANTKNGVRWSGFDADRPITRTDAELREDAEARAKAVREYEASPEGQAERARIAKVRASEVAMQQAFGLPS